MVCHKSLATKERLTRFCMFNNVESCFCKNIETKEHLFFECPSVLPIWIIVLKWMKVHHNPGGWDQKVGWITNICKQKGWKKKIVQCSFTETIHKCWKIRNLMSFGGKMKDKIVVNSIIDAIAYRCGMKTKIRKHLSSLLMP